MLPRGAVALLGALLCSVGCRQIIGIEGAEVEPALADGGSDSVAPPSAVSSAGAGAAAIEQGAGGGAGQAGEEAVAR